MEEKEAYPPTMLGITAFCVFVIGLLGTFGNLLAALSLLCNQKLRQRPSTAFMVNLPGCLIPVCAIGMPMFGAGCIQQIMYGTVTLSKEAIVVIFALGLTFSQVHIHTICALAFNRLVAVMWPAMYKKLMRPRIVAAYLVFLWIYSALLWIPLSAGLVFHLEYNEEELMVSISDKAISRTQKAGHVFITYLLPIIFTTVCYLVMYLKVRKIRRLTEKNRRNTTPMIESNVIHQWDNHITRTILVIYVVLISCSIPHLIIHVMRLHSKQKVVWLLFHIVFWLQFCIDPIVYVIYSRVYRRAVKEYLGKIFPGIGFFQVAGDPFPKSDGRSDIKTQNCINSPASSKGGGLRPPPQKVEFSSEVHRDLLDPKFVQDKS